ncbi:ATP-binding protein [Streptomyces narbonensis]|uniref:ATP-binding protein n=1 Tax=Streptomyces narbonensis TaxID=67333 RepID=A0ABV3CGU6_9ACTN
MVMDTDRTEPAPSAASGDRDESGRGLLLVQALAARWGVERFVTGKRLWCLLEAEAEPVDFVGYLHRP